MDSIIAKCPRLEVWQENLGLLNNTSCVSGVQGEDLVVYSGAKPSWFKLDIGLICRCYATVSRELTQALARPPTGV